MRNHDFHRYVPDSFVAKMATITVTSRLEKENYPRTKLTDVSLKETVSSLRAKILESANLNSKLFGT